MRFLKLILRTCTFLLLFVPANSVGPITLSQTTVAQVTKVIVTKPTPYLTPTSTPHPTAIPATVTPPTEVEIPTTYVVQEGDTLAQIAMKFDLQIGYLAYQNEIDNPDLIYVGQSLNIDKTVTPPDVGGKIIVVKLGSQKMYVYQDENLLKTFDVSTGVEEFPTVTGTYYVYIKYADTSMSGPGYNIKHVPWTMYFFQGYGIHGAPWHNNFGQHMSHGCVNMRVEDAEWLFEWTPLYTPVQVDEW